MENNIIEILSQSFQSVNRVGTLVGFLVAFILSGLVFLWLRDLLMRYKKTVIEIPLVKRVYSPLTVKPKLDPLLYEKIQDLITDFKKVEKSAQAVPAYVLERYSEFFLHSLKRLEGKKHSRALRVAYPILVGYQVECEVFKNDRLFIFETEVLQRSGGTLVLRNISTLQFVLEKGDEMVVAYTVERYHFRGRVRVLQVLEDESFVISQPKEVYLSAERRYERLPFGIVAMLRDIREKTSKKILLMDLSWEGCRVRCSRLDKRVVYYLYLPVAPERMLQMECVVGRELLREGEEYVYSLQFLYLSYEARQELMRVLKEKALEIKLASTYPVGSSGEKQ